jgi:hypothetical protein
VRRADPGDGYGDTHVDAARAPPSHGQTQRWPAPSGQGRVSGQRRRVDPASAWARQWVLRDPAAVRRAQRFMAGPGATGRPGPLPHHRVRARLHRGRGRRQPPAVLTAPRRPHHRSDLRRRHDPRRYRADHRAGPPRLRIRRIERRSLASAFAWLRASRQSTTRRLLRTTSRSAARDCCSLTKGAAYSSSLDGPLTCELDENQASSSARFGSRLATPICGKAGASPSLPNSMRCATAGRRRCLLAGRGAGCLGQNTKDYVRSGRRRRASSKLARGRDQARGALWRGSLSGAARPRAAPGPASARLCGSGRRDRRR